MVSNEKDLNAATESAVTTIHLYIVFHSNYWSILPSFRDINANGTGACCLPFHSSTLYK